MSRVVVAAVEVIPRKAWLDLPYHGYTACATCREFDRCCGINPESRVCILCFEFAHGCTAPNYRRRRA